VTSISLNHLAIITAAILAFIIGGAWYGPLFGRAWMHETGITPESAAAGNQAKIFGLAFLWLALGAASALDTACHEGRYERSGSRAPAEYCARL
jgi:hypothetical protein